MIYTNWIFIFLGVQVVHFLGTWKFYKAAGKNPLLALIPVYNAVVLMQIIKRPRWWVLLLFVPVINILMFPIIWVETLRSFDKNTLKDTWGCVLTLGFYLYYVNYTQKLIYIKDRNLKPKNKTGEWVSSLLFAVIAATLVHTYVMQPYVIPTSSLEKSLLVGDFLFVSKFHYGARVPSTAVAAPMVHDTLPFLKIRSYLKKPQLPYLRLPGFQKIKRNDIVVFNWPADTVQQFFKTPDRKIIKPIDKKSNYVKRCVAIAGDTLQLIDGTIFINGKKSIMPERAKPQFTHKVVTHKPLSTKIIYEKFKVKRGEASTYKGDYYLNLDSLTAKKVAQNPLVKSVQRFTQPRGIYGGVFPKDENNHWNVDNYGPIYVPKKGRTIALNKENLPLYKKIIQDYEHHKLTSEQGRIYIDDKPADTYTFAQDYYWMMGDNRHYSEDSRYWGFVPFDHIVGKPVFIWFSWNSQGKGLGKIRWERLFTTVHGQGKPHSFFVYFLVALLLYWGYGYYKKRKAKKPVQRKT